VKELIDQFIQHGLTSQQAEEAMRTISEWLNEEYPVAGVLLASWIKNEEAPKS